MALRFSVFGLQLEADEPLPGLTPAREAGTPDVRVRLQAVPNWWHQESHRLQEQVYRGHHEEPRGEPTLTVGMVLGGAYFWFRYQDGTEFLIDRNGSEIWVTWAETSTLADAATYLLGPVLGFLLRLRGTLCLHASAMVVGDRAVALVGAPGAGKSTLAAAFALQGHPILADDIAALRTYGDTFLVLPAYPRLCLWPSSVEALFPTVDALPRITPNWEKRYLDLSGNGFRFSIQPFPLEALYLLGENYAEGGVRIEKISGVNALMELVKNTYVNYLLDAEMRARDLELLSRLALRVPLRHIRLSADPARMAETCSAIVDDLQSSRPSAGVVTPVRA